MTDPNAQTPEPEAGESLPSGFLPPSEVLGRYVVLHRLGTGGMGVVYAAYDPKLDRKIALKLLRRASNDPRKRKRAQDRLLAEARAMAKLTHPNVITVHDVAVVSGRVVVAMEYVDGRTLTATLLRRELGWRDVVRVLSLAGRGLESAHEAGIVHRDFKPDNVMLARDGRVLVMDFGLARALDGDDGSDKGPPTASAAGVAPRASGVGTRGVGTPAYMAPEQHRGRQVDARTDQFSFCVTLYEALYGHRPFTSESAEEIQAEIERAELPDAPAHTKVPPRLREIITRGLSPEPADRFGSMRELLGALEQDPSATRKRWMMGAGVVSVVGIGGAAAMVTGSDAAPTICNQAPSRLAGVWDDDLRDEVGVAFSRSDKPYAAAAAKAVTEALDRYANEWIAMHVESCEATKVRGEQSDAMLDLRMECLGRRLEELDAVTELLVRADSEIVGAGVGIVGKLVPVTVCADLQRLRAPAPLPDDPKTRLRIEEVRGQLAEAKAYEGAGRAVAGLAVATDAVERARVVGYSPLLAQALTRQGSLATATTDYPRAERSLREAVQVAARGRDDETAARAWIALLGVTGHLKVEHERAEEISNAAKAAVERAGAPADLEAELSAVVGAIALGRGRLEEAQEALERALARQRHAVGDGHPSLARFHNNVAVVYLQRDDPQGARRSFQLALEIQTRAYGPDHPLVAGMTANLAAVLLGQGDTAEARPMLHRALSVWERAEASHPNEIGLALNNLGYAELLDGNDREAEALFRRARAVWESVDAEHANVGRALANLGRALQRQGRYDEALDVLERSRTIASRTMDDDHSDVAEILTDLGIVHLERGDAKRGIEHLERALAIRRKRPGLSGELPRLRFALARALFDSDAPRALELARNSAAGLRALPEEHPMRRVINDVEGWLGHHEPPSAKPLP